MLERYLEMKDGHRLFVRIWNDVEKPAGTLHINHGMAEHSLRYDDFARYMNSLGFIVYAQDHRGHGFTMEEEERGWFAPSGGWDIVVKDSIAVDQLIMNENEALPHFILGHSMGSFITRCEITRVPDYFSAAVIVGTGAGKGIAGKLGKALAHRNAVKNGSKMPDHLLNKLSFGSYNKRFSPARTGFEWLSRDEAEVRKYIDDPLCGFVCSSQFFIDLITLIENANDKDAAGKIGSDLPMLIVSGDADPVGGYGKGVMKVAAMYRKAGVREVKVRLFKDDRHEILNELDRKDVYECIGSYLSGIAQRYDHE